MAQHYRDVTLTSDRRTYPYLLYQLRDIATEYGLGFEMQFEAEYRVRLFTWAKIGIVRYSSTDGDYLNGVVDSIDVIDSISIYI